MLLGAVLFMAPPCLVIDARVDLQGRERAERKIWIGWPEQITSAAQQLGPHNKLAGYGIVTLQPLDAHELVVVVAVFVVPVVREVVGRRDLQVPYPLEAAEVP